MNNQFTAYSPAEALRPFVQSYWFGTFNVPGERDFTQQVVPNGCIELIIHLDGDHCALRKGDRWTSTAAYIVMGMHTRPYEVRFARPVRVFGIRFYPDGVRNVFGIAPSSFLSTFEDASDVLGDALRGFSAKVISARSAEAVVAQADAYMEGQLAKHYRSYDYTHAVMSIIREAGGQATYAEARHQAYISDRQLQRTFKEQYGITVGDYMRLARMTAIYRYMQTKPERLTELSHHLKFFDQSHFIREFRNYVGIAPGQFLKRREGFIVNGVEGEAPDS